MDSRLRASPKSLGLGIWDSHPACPRPCLLMRYSTNTGQVGLKTDYKTAALDTQLTFDHRGNREDAMEMQVGLSPSTVHRDRERRDTVRGIYFPLAVLLRELESLRGRLSIERRERNPRDLTQGAAV